METNSRRIIIAGGSGLIGSACARLLKSTGYEVLVLTRRTNTAEREITWNPAKRSIQENVVDGALAVINLCGLPLPAKRWSKKYKSALRNSRILPASFLRELYQGALKPPTYYIGASAVGIYGDRGDVLVGEEDAHESRGFVQDLVNEWEHTHQLVPAAQNFIFRIGIVIALDGGFIEKVLPPSRFGIYPCFGSGDQIISWIQIRDLARMFLHVISTPLAPGIYNAVAPDSVSQKALMQKLRQISGNPGLIIPVPQFALRLILGEMSGMLFESTRVSADKILASGFRFEVSDIASAIEKVLRDQRTT
jgi:uncharacterized protein (TIGR01777 family)